MHQVFVSIGSNIDPKENIKIAKDYLDKLFDCISSRIYETKAHGFEGNDFINCVVGFETNLLVSELQKHLKQIELKMGRTKDQKGMSNRVIDLDIILYGDHVLEEDNLDIPSKDIENYLFILEPLAEIAGELLHPVSKITFSELLKKLKSN
jgi:2-amino-4-hydroxy-6-hydroxymethyldihydropteridine diphosphokinase